MNLVAVPVWLARHFDPESAPSHLNVLRLLRDGKLPGRKVGGTWYIDETAWLAGDDDLVQRILEAG
ncbi:hypothetical protein [Marilutibacter spongiae]|uniref:Excisionase n=1 Tax=Marilutibacter spongiae TaxID=2025720 RepID=A0A7W3TL82_9GAMM|nr:hypothetical protein [Lysobacter spongiae]MBB1060372.1 hypothetical protein [Lysobacter spongiae]